MKRSIALQADWVASSGASAASTGRSRAGPREPSGGTRIYRLEVKGYVKDWKNKDD